MKEEDGGQPHGRGFLRGFAAPLVLCGALVLSACSGSDSDIYFERPVESLYNSAMNALEAEDYFEAAKLFDEVDRQHPYSTWASKAQLMSAYSHYQRNKYDDAIIGLDRFIQLHPSSPDVPYAFYLKGLSYYEQIRDVERDQNMTTQAVRVLTQVVMRYPDSRYTRDAKLKLDLTFDHLAGKEMDIGRKYLRKGHYLAAINRFRVVVDEYQTTTHVAEALHRMVEAYLALGIDEEARRTASVLGHNFPGSEWYIDSYQMIEGKQIRPDEKPWFKFW